MDHESQTSVTMAQWIAIEPLPPSHRHHLHDTVRQDSLGEPPSFDASQFDIVLRRQRVRPADDSVLKHTNVPSRFLNLSSDFEFAGWGSITHLKLNESDLARGTTILQHAHDEKTLGHFTASAVAGNDLLGGVFYTLPPVFALAGVYTPISLLVATLALFLWRPIIQELASALPISGALYSYLINVSSKTFALIGATLILLDLASTAVVSAATAASYLSGEVILPFPAFVGAILVLIIFTIISLSGLRESARLAFGLLALHMATMVALMVASAVAWARAGNGQLVSNWEQRTTSAGPMIHQIFNGVCLGMLGLTGFECSPDYIARIRPGRFPKVLRNLHMPAIALYGTISLLVMALLPMDKILGGANVLSLLAEIAGGRWLRIWVVVDAIVVLCGGVLTGILSSSELLKQLARDRVVPGVFLNTLPVVGSPYVAVLSFVAFSGILYASAGASLNIVSSMFSIVWLSVMTLFPVSLLLLKFNRRRLPRRPRTSLWVIFSALVVCPVIFAGNIAISPSTFGYFAAYFIGVGTLFIIAQNKIAVLRWVYWACDQNASFHRWSSTRKWGHTLMNFMTKLRHQPVCLLTRTDEINHLFQMMMYVRENEETSCVKLVHFYDEVKGVPSELEANAKILDETFPQITVDLILVPASFSPLSIAALSERTGIPRALMFMSCPGPDFPYEFQDFGTRIITL